MRGGQSFADYGIDDADADQHNGKTFCPECRDRRKSKNRNDRPLSVDTKDGLWNCHNCGWSGRLRSGERSAPGYGARLLTKERKPTAKPHPIPEGPLSERARAFFESRGIGPDVLDRARIRSGLEPMPQFGGKPVATIQYPYYDESGELFNVKFRGPEKKFKMVKDARMAFYGLNDCVGAPTVVIVEGEMDKLAFAQAGVWTVLSVPNGASAGNAQLDYLDASALRIFREASSVVVATDGDGPGQALAEELTRRIGRAKVSRVLSWPDGCKDANDVLMKHGAQALLDVLSQATPEPMTDIIDNDDLSVYIDELYETGRQPGESTGWPEFDSTWSVKLGQLTTVTATPGTGKSSWLDQLAVNLAEKHGWRTCYYSPENFPIQDHASSLISIRARRPFDKSHPFRMTREEKDQHKAWVLDHFRWTYPEETDPTLDYILELIEACIFRYGSNVIIIDPWNELEPRRPQGMSETEYIGHCLTRVRRFAREFHVHVILVVHPTKLQWDKEAGSYPVVQAYDLAGSAKWYDKSDNMLSLWRKGSAEDNYVVVHILKVRFKWVGRKGRCHFTYDLPTGRFDTATMLKEGEDFDG